MAKCADVIPESLVYYTEIGAEYPIVPTGQLIAYNEHPDSEISRFMNGPADPHWNFWYWFPGEPEDPPDPLVAAWPVEGASVSTRDYWRQLREQWLEHPSLPGPERRRSRNSMHISGLGESPWADFVEGITGLPTGWIGLHRFTLDTPDAPEVVTLDSGSQSRWTFTDCDGGFDPNNIIINAHDGQFAVTAEFALGSFTVTPFLYPHIAHSIGISWLTPNVKAIRVKLVNAYGESALLTESQAIAVRPKEASDSRYVGSWAQDWNADEPGVSDHGIDLLAAGDSEAVMQSGERAAVYQLLAGFTATALRFEIEVIDPDILVKLEYPTFHLSGDPGVVLQETGQFSSLFWKNGPLVRHGMWDVWDTGTELLRVVPEIRAAGHIANPLDWIVWRNLLLLGEAKDDEMDADLADWFDPVEYTERNDLFIGTLAALLDRQNPPNASAPVLSCGRGLVTNLMSEVPPLIICPVPKRAEFEVSGEADNCIAYDFCTEPRYLINRVRADIYSNDSPRVLWTEPLATQPATGWVVTAHSHALDNNEGDSFFFVVGGTDFASLSPWHGYASVVSLIPPAVWNWADRNGGYHRAAAMTGRIYYWRSDQAVPGAWIVEAALVADGTEPHMVADHRDRVDLVFGFTEKVWETHSDDRGQTWSAPVEYMEGIVASHPTIAVGTDGTLLRAAWSQGQIVAQIRETGDIDWSAPFTFRDSTGIISFSDAQFHFQQGREGADRWVLTAIANGETNAAEWWSGDGGRTWTRVT